MAQVDGTATVSDFDVAVRIIASDGVTEVFNFNDEAAGIWVTSVQEPDDEVSRTRKEADHVDGDYEVEEHDAAGDLVVIVYVEGSTWAQCKTRWQAARAAYRAEARYYVEVELEGVKTVYRTGRPDSVQPGDPDLKNRLQTYSLRWHVQPNPTITIV